MLGNAIDTAFDTKDQVGLSDCITRAVSLQNEHISSDEKAVLDYFIGNAWSDLDGIVNKSSINIWQFERVEHTNAIKAFRRCISTENTSLEIQKGVFLQAYTNLGNMFSESGRVIYAIELWKCALDIESVFAMAGCNLGHGLLYYANYLYDTNHKAILLRHAYSLFKKYIDKPGIHQFAKQAFEYDLNWIQGILTDDYLSKSNNFREYSLGRSIKEKTYKNWILANSLFLNPLNDIYNDTAIAHDIISLPNMMVKDYSAPVFHGFYNQIKQEYITARYLFYNYKYELYEDDLHYSDKDRNLVDTLDYPQYGYRYEQLKNSFKMLYSIFDKIGYFINEYYKLGIDKDKVYFRNVWIKDGKINPIIENLNNKPLRGLYFLSKDFYSKDMEYLELTDPEARKIAELRNNVEHKYCKIHWFKPDISEGESRYDTLSYSINETDFSDKTLKLLKCVREAIIYLSLSIHVEEKKTDSENSDKLIMPLMMFDYD